MNATVVKKTQDTLGKVIKKPPLNEKLLNKPPFRYLHDIFIEVIRITGFMKGLYEGNEMISDGVKEKDQKIAFLQKAIDVVMLVTGEPLAAKPARIVAGHEPEKTNELLQAVAKCCLNRLSSDDAVKRVLSGEKVDLKTKPSTSRSHSKDDREGRKRPPSNDKKITERSSSRDQKEPDQPKKKENQHEDENGEHQLDRERSDRHHRSEQDHPAKGRDNDKSRDRERDKEQDKERVRDRDKDRKRDRDRDREKPRDKYRERQKDEDEKNRSGESKNDKARESEDLQQKPVPEEQSSKSAKSVPASDNPTKIPRPSSAKGQRRRPKIGSRADDSDSEGDGDVHLAQRAVSQENGGTGGSSVPIPVPSDMTSKRISRPSSARPAPPRVKKQESHADAAPAERLSSAKTPAPVIMDGKKLSEDEEDEDEQFLVEEAVPPPPDAPELERKSAQELDTEENHGGLVKKILETKKNYEHAPSSPKSKEQNSVSEATFKKEREMVTNEVGRLRSSIQTVCSSSQSLGKIVDYIQEDMDSIQAELHTWRQENKQHAQALLQEQRVTEEVLEPLKAKLSELEQQIKDQVEKNSTLMANILNNEERIKKMVAGINTPIKT